MPWRRAAWILLVWAAWRVCGFYTPAGAAVAESDPARLSLPEDLGRIVSVLRSGPQWVIFIADFHCQPEAQENIAGILEYLAGHWDIPAVEVEGASRVLNVSLLSGYPLAWARREVGKSLLGQGEYSGAEYYAATRQPKLLLRGLEDPCWYRESEQCLREMLGAEQQGWMADLRERLAPAGVGKNPEQGQCLRDLNAIEHYLNAGASPREVREIRKTSARIFLERIKRTAETGGEGEPWEKVFPESSLESADRFYRLVDLRSRHFAEITAGRLERNHSRLAVMIAGGYHAEAVARFLQARRISCLVIEPRVPSLPGINHYYERLLGRPSPWLGRLAGVPAAFAPRPLWSPELPNPFQPAAPADLLAAGYAPEDEPVRRARALQQLLGLATQIESKANEVRSKPGTLPEVWMPLPESGGAFAGPWWPANRPGLGFSWNRAGRKWRVVLMNRGEWTRMGGARGKVRAVAQWARNRIHSLGMGPIWIAMARAALGAGPGAWSSPERLRRALRRSRLAWLRDRVQSGDWERVQAACQPGVLLSPKEQLRNLLFILDWGRQTCGPNFSAILNGMKTGALEFTRDRLLDFQELLERHPEAAFDLAMENSRNFERLAQSAIGTGGGPGISLLLGFLDSGRLARVLEKRGPDGAERWVETVVRSLRALAVHPRDASLNEVWKKCRDQYRKNESCRDLFQSLERALAPLVPGKRHLREVRAAVEAGKFSPLPPAASEPEMIPVRNWLGEVEGRGGLRPWVVWRSPAVWEKEIESAAPEPPALRALKFDTLASQLRALDPDWRGNAEEERALTALVRRFGKDPESRRLLWEIMGEAPARIGLAAADRLLEIMAGNPLAGWRSDWERVTFWMENGRLHREEKFGEIPPGSSWELEKKKERTRETLLAALDLKSLEFETRPYGLWEDSRFQEGIMRIYWKLREAGNENPRTFLDRELARAFWGFPAREPERARELWALVQKSIQAWPAEQVVFGLNASYIQTKYAELPASAEVPKIKPVSSRDRLRAAGEWIAGSWRRAIKMDWLLDFLEVNISDFSQGADYFEKRPKYPRSLPAPPVKEIKSGVSRWGLFRSPAGIGIRAVLVAGWKSLPSGKILQGQIRARLRNSGGQSRWIRKNRYSACS